MNVINKCVKPLFLLSGLLSCGILLHAQDQKPENEAWRHEYRATATKYNDLIHTRLEVKFDYDKSYMYGKEWVTIKPHFYPTDSLTLDAKGMDLKQVAIEKDGKKTNLKYDYDGMILRIHLDRTYSIQKSTPYS